MLARCRMVSICSPDSFAFFIADVARGQPDKLRTEDGGVALVTGPGRAPKPQNMAASEAGHRGLFSGCLQAQRCLQEGEPPDQGARVAAVCT